jgi:hypothetical protein
VGPLAFLCLSPDAVPVAGVSWDAAQASGILEFLDTNGGSVVATDFAKVRCGSDLFRWRVACGAHLWSVRPAPSAPPPPPSHRQPLCRVRAFVVCVCVPQELEGLGVSASLADVQNALDGLVYILRCRPRAVLARSLCAPASVVVC